MRNCSTLDIDVSMERGRVLSSLFRLLSKDAAALRSLGAWLSRTGAFSDAMDAREVEAPPLYGSSEDEVRSPAAWSKASFDRVSSRQ